MERIIGDDEFFVCVPAGRSEVEAYSVVYMLDEIEELEVKARGQVVVEEGGSAKMMVEYGGTKQVQHDVCNVIDIMLGDSAALDIVIVQKINSATRLSNIITVKQAASSTMKIHFITAGVGIAINSMNVTLEGVNAEHHAFGLSMTQQNEHIENNISIHHTSPRCKSTQLFKHILYDTSTGSYTGRTAVNKDAQKTVAYQRSNNIIMHREAKMNIKPQLEIYADDVKCSHGATVGQLDAEALYYIRSRGISEPEAAKMLLRAFAGEIIDGIDCEPFRAVCCDAVGNIY